MDIKILGGLSIENFAEENPANQNIIQIQKELYDSGQIAGIQLRVGHDFTNQENIETLKQRVLTLGIPFIVHGAAENLGVDLGECLDERGIFSQYKKQNPEKNWNDFNLNALKNAKRITEDNSYLLDKRIIIHPGYVLRNRIKRGELKAVNTLKRLEDIYFSLETIPETAIPEGNPFFGIGSNVCSMKNLLKSRERLDVLIDFTHVLVSANQKKPSSPEYFSKLISGFLEFPVSNFTHFSGLTYGLKDEHSGFLGDNKAAGDNPRREIIKEALAELGRRYPTRGKNIYVALEMRSKDTESTKRQINAFIEQYCR